MNQQIITLLSNYIQDSEQENIEQWLKQELKNNLTNEEKYLFNQGKFYEITSLLYMLERYDQTGTLYVVPSETDIQEMIQAGCSPEDLKQYNEQLSKTWKQLITNHQLNSN